jgi:hypothetical protein
MAAPHGSIGCSSRLIVIARDEHATCSQRSAGSFPAPHGSTKCNRQRVAIARDEHAATSRAVRALQQLSSAELVEGSAARLHQVPPQARRDRARRARHVPSALCRRPSQPSWRRAAPHGSTKRRRLRVAIAGPGDEHAKCRPRPAVALPRASRAGGGQRRTAALRANAGTSRSHETSTPRAVCALQSSSPAALAESSVARQHQVPPPARRGRARRARHVPSAHCSRSPRPRWRRAAPIGGIKRRSRRVAIA